MSLLDSIENVLKKAGRPLSAKEITQALLSQGLWETAGRTPAATVGARLYVDMRKGNSRFLKAGKGMFGLSNTPSMPDKPPEKARQRAKSNDSGYVYILTNPSFRKDWVKIGMTERPVDTRTKELDNTAVPLPFEVYATLHTKHRRRIEKLLHGMIDDFDCNARIRKSREFFNINPELAVRLLTRAAQVFDEEANICKVFKGLIRNPKPRKPPRRLQMRSGSTPGNRPPKGLRPKNGRARRNWRACWRGAKGMKAPTAAYCSFSQENAPADKAPSGGRLLNKRD